MTGIEAWGVVAPILASHSALRGTESYAGFNYRLNYMDEAYVTVYGALKQLDEGRVIPKGEITSCETCLYEERAENEKPCKQCSKRFLNNWRAKE